MSTREQAVELARRGFYVFRLRGKYPAEEGWQEEATTDPARVYSRWTCPVFENDQGWNIGIATGRRLPTGGFLAAIDEDVKDGKQGDKSLLMLEAINDELIPRNTFRTRTPTGGRHHLVSTPKPIPNSVEALAPGVDIRGLGGYVVAPGSTRTLGAYEIENDGPFAPAPKFVAELADKQKPKREATSDVNLDKPAVIEQATYYLQHNAPYALAGEGGNNTTYKVFAKLREMGVSESTAFDLAAENWNDTKADPPWSLEELATICGNAYKHGQNAPGSAMAENEFDAVPVDETKLPPVRAQEAPLVPDDKPKSRALHVIRWGDAEPDLEQQYLIDDLIDLGTMVVTYGDSNVGKTYVKLDMCFHVAAGKDWNGHKVKQGLVVYVAAEGGRGFLKRIAAFKKHYGVKDLPFSLVPCPIDLQSERADTKKLIELIQAEEEHFGQKCVLVVIDTLARAMGGGDENTAVDMSKLVGHSDRLRAATGATVDFIHHTGKDASKGARGSSALRAATDTEIEISEGVFEAKKQRDMAKGKPLNFELVDVEVGERSDGKKISACIVRWVAPNEFDDRISPQAQQLFELLEAALAARRDEISEDESLSEIDKTQQIANARIPWKLWELSILSSLKGPRGKPMTRSNIYPFRLELSNSGRVKKDNANQWFIP